MNAAFETTSGYTPDDVLEKTPNVLKSEAHTPDFYKELWASISSGNTWEGRITNRKKDGTTYDQESIIYPIRDDRETVVNYVAISRDITQELAIEKQMRQTQKMNAIGELAGGVSHDFNNILTAILGYVALCMNSVEEESKTLFLSQRNR